ncbi:MAG: hypothetical protein ACLP62_13845 [Acidimicrobiales bacterium]
MSRVRRGVAAFGRFGWEFLIGDTPELFVAVVAVVVVAVLLRHQRVAAVVVLPVAVIVVLVGSVFRGRRRAPRAAPPDTES